MIAIDSVAGLKNAIQILEAESEMNRQLLKEQFYLTSESLRPINILKHTLKSMSVPPILIEAILGTTMGLAVNYFSKKQAISTAGYIIKKLIGSILKLGVTNTIAKHSHSIKSIGQGLIQHFLHKNEMNIDKS